MAGRAMRILRWGASVVLGLPVVLVVLGLGTAALLDRSTGVLQVDGQRRTFLLYVPSRYDPRVRSPLIISLHGAMTWPALEAAVDGWRRIADSTGAVVVYPGGTGWGPKVWNMAGSQHPATMPDVRFISRLLDTLEAAYAIDPRRVYVSGFSNGGGMAFVLSCTLGRRIAAVGVVAAAEALPWRWCPEPTPLPMLAMHGQADPIVPYGGGKVWMAPRPFPSVRAWAAEWARRDNCESVPSERQVATGVLRRSYAHCAAGPGVELYTLAQAGHQWPGGRALPRWLVGAPDSTVDATRVLWAFFEQFETRPLNAEMRSQRLPVTSAQPGCGAVP